MFNINRSHVQICHQKLSPFWASVPMSMLPAFEIGELVGYGFWIESVNTLKRLSVRMLRSKARGNLFECRCWLRVTAVYNSRRGNVSIFVSIWKWYWGKRSSNPFGFSPQYRQCLKEKKDMKTALSIREVSSLSVNPRFIGFNFSFWCFILLYLVWMVHQVHWYYWVGAPKLRKCVFQKTRWWKFSVKWKWSVTA